MEKNTSVMVTTKHRGVFYGRIIELKEPSLVRLNKCRNVIHWAGTQGFLGLTSHGPDDGSRIGAEAGGPVTLYDLTSLTECSEVASKKFESWL